MVSAEGSITPDVVDRLGARVVLLVPADDDQVTAYCAPELTATQIVALRWLGAPPSNAPDFASTTVNRLRAYGYIAGKGYGLRITPAGRARLEVL